MTIKSTYSLDVESVRVLEVLAQRWNVSKSEVLRRALRIAATEGAPGEGASLGTLDRLQTSLRKRQVDVPQWAREQKPSAGPLAAFQVRMIHLDTSFLIQALTPGSPEDLKLRNWIGKGKTLRMSNPTWTELLCGPLDRSELEWAAEIVGHRQDFTPEHAVVAARLFNESGRRRGSLIDCMIAATALAGGAHRDRECRGLSPVQRFRPDDGIKPLFYPDPHRAASGPANRVARHVL